MAKLQRIGQSIFSTGFLNAEAGVLEQTGAGAVGLLAVTLAALALLLAFYTGPYKQIIETAGAVKFFWPFVPVALLSAIAAIVDFVGASDSKSGPLDARAILFGLGLGFFATAVAGVVYLIWVFLFHAGVRQAAEKDYEESKAEARRRGLARALEEDAGTFARVSDPLVRQGPADSQERSELEGQVATLRGSVSSPPNLELLWDALIRLGDLDIEAGHLEAARPNFADAAEAAEVMVEISENNLGGLTRLSRALSQLGYIDRRIGDLTEAQRAFEAALEVDQRLARTNPGYEDFIRYQSSDLLDLGDTSAAQGEFSLAAEHYRSALVIDDQLAWAHPGDAIQRQRLMLDYFRLADAIRSTGALAAAEDF
jgi:tetratricopeptide (TPR) repeat protein